MPTQSPGTCRFTSGGSPGQPDCRFSAFPRALVALLVAASLALGPLAASAQIFGKFSITDEAKLGEKYNTLVRARLPVIEDPEIAGYVRALVSRVATGMPPQPWVIRPSVVRSGAINAFAGPAGYVFVFTGLILAMDDESQVAAVLAHELAHVTQRHIAQRIEQSQAATMGAMLGMLAGAVLGGSGGSAMLMGSIAATKAAMLQYSRENENEADHVGLNYLIEAGYNPSGMAEAFEVLKRNKLYRGAGFPSYLSTHPGLEERISYLQDRVKRLSPKLLERKTDNKTFMRVQTLIRARYAEIQTASAWYQDPAHRTSCIDTLGRAIIEERQSRVKEAEELFGKALECGGDDSLMLREAGRFAFENGDFPNAAQRLQKAVIINPQDIMALFYYSRLLGEQGEYRQAIEYMQRVKKQVPEDSEVRQHLGRMHGQAGDTFHAHLELAHSAVYALDRQQAEFHAKQARLLARSDAQRSELAEFEKVLLARSEFW